MRSSEVSIGKVVASATDGNELKQLTEWSKEPTVLDLKDDLSACKSSKCPTLELHQKRHCLLKTKEG
jgi:hypothetical protein